MVPGACLESEVLVLSIEAIISVYFFILFIICQRRRHSNDNTDTEVQK